MKKIWLLIFCIYIQNTMAQIRIPNFETRQVIQSTDGQIELYLYSATDLQRANRQGVLPAELRPFAMSGALFWKNSTRVVLLGDRPSDAFPHPQGAYVAYVKRGKLILAFRYLNGEEEIFNEQFSARAYNRTLLANFSAAGITLQDSQSNLTHFYSVDRNNALQVTTETLNASDRSILEKYGRSLVQMARQNVLSRPVLLETRFSQFSSNLNTEKTALCLVGEADFGGRDLIYELAYRLASGNLAEDFSHYDMYEIDIQSLGTEGRADFSQQKISEIIGAARNRKVILFFDGLERMADLGGGGTNNLISGLLPSIEAGGLLVIGLSPRTNNGVEYLKNHVPAALSTFQEFPIEPYSATEEMALYYAQISEELTQEKQIILPRELFERFIQRTDYNFPNSSHPSSDFKVIERLIRNLEGIPRPHYVSFDEFERALHELTPPSPFMDRDLISGLENFLSRKLVGQDHNVQKVLQGFQAHSATGGGLFDKKPLIFFALGPSGVGKTFTGNLIEEHFGVVKKEVQMGSFTSEHTIHTLIGSPPSFVGSEEPGDLVKFVLQNPTGLLLLDEYDKAHGNVYQSLNHLFDVGHIIDLTNTTAYFNRGLVWITSNFGLELIQAWERRNPDWREWPKEKLDLEESALIQSIMQDLSENINGRAADAGKRLDSWTLGRLPETNWLIFHTFSETENVELAELFVQKAIKNYCQENGFVDLDIVVNHSVYTHISNRYGSVERGARPVIDGSLSLVGGILFQQRPNANKRYLLNINTSGEITLEERQ